VKRYVADTHAVLWFAAGEMKRLGRTGRRISDGLRTGRTAIVVSVVSLWEIAMLHDEGAIRLPAGFTAWTDALEALPGVAIEPLTRGDVDEARALRDLVDPHDRLIAATSLRLGAPLLTADERMTGNRRVSTVW
jgi:PIN domain nuclease of toxin-antitoxin system